ncbi:MAG: ABC transporter permease [Armatimonadota bacterium]|nr:ABC transporter permease [Armatimonadota bacterium]MDR5703804.1 ABC transporter permease [Armatimonadota bacterium]MDR7435315.1 ABC transporter permease [Armatimonadota bacterium]
MSGLLRYIVQRILALAVTLFFVALIVFLLVRLLPGDPARVIAGVFASEEDVQRIRVQLNLDKPLPTQFVYFLASLLRGDLGISARTSEPVMREILSRLPATVKLAAASTFIAAAVGIPLGTIAATKAHSSLDFSISALVLFGISMPVYWLGIILIIIFAIHLRWFPAAGADQPSSLVLPSLTLAAFSVAFVARMTRSSMLEVLRQDYIRTAWAKGLSALVVLYRHALRNAMIPILTVIGLQFGELLGGAVLTESVFSWPGVGRLLVDSIFSRDYPVVQGIVLIFACLFALVNLLVDVLYGLIDPRIRYE